MNKENKNNQAFPSTSINDVYTGLTKREYFAAMAMQGILAANEKIEYGNYGKTREMSSQEIAERSIWAADELLTQLNQQNT